VDNIYGISWSVPGIPKNTSEGDTENESTTLYYGAALLPPPTKNRKNKKKKYSENTTEQANMSKTNCSTYNVVN